MAASYGGLPLAFEANRGQLERQVLYAARGRGYTLALTRRSVLLGMEGGVELAIGMLGARPVRVVPASALEGRVNYLIGRDRSRWRTGIPTFARA